ncbi:MAG: sulfotransferase [Gammaproteobacteria bacterium]|nr:sulfotransferase [Gammaproteobacteria bacterium]
MEEKNQSSLNSPVIVLSAGRSGSTLLQKLLNTNPRLVIWGEHAGFLTPMMNVYRSVETSPWIDESRARGAWLLEQPRTIDPAHWSAWDGSFSRADFRNAMKLYLDLIFCRDVPEGIRWGFKEIRYFNRAIIDFMEVFYPGAQFLLMVRDPVDSCVSFTTSNTEARHEDPVAYEKTMNRVVKNQIDPAFRFYREIFDQNPGNIHAVYFEDVIRHPDKTMAKIAEFLRLEEPFAADDLARILDVNIVSERKRTAPELKAELAKMASRLLSAHSNWYKSIRG